MGCNEVKDENLPTLLCNFVLGDDEQKNYCLKLKDNFKSDKTIRFQISSVDNLPFSVRFKLNGRIYEIQNNFVNTDESMNNALEQMYDLLNRNKKAEA